MIIRLPSRDRPFELFDDEIMVMMMMVVVMVMVILLLVFYWSKLDTSPFANKFMIDSSLFRKIITFGLIFL
jgi:heme/copper-type cytochrome/quinol oxidase subunit 2